jgi:four helix bundle protein
MLSSCGMGARTFKEIVAWQLARELRMSLRPLWRKPAVFRDYKLREQLRGAARSATANIAEGFQCSHAEYARFLEISSRSLEEVEDRLIEMIDEELVTAAEAEKSLRLKMRASRAIAGLRRYLLTTPDPPTYRPSITRRRLRR